MRDAARMSRRELAARTPPRAGARLPRWVRGGGLTTLLFLLPMLLDLRGVLVVPDRAHGDHVAAAHEPRAAARPGSGSTTSAPCSTTRCCRRRSRTPPSSPALALIFGYPVPLIAAVLMSEVRRFRGIYSALAYLPVVIPPVVAVLLWKTFYDASPTGVFNTILGWVHLGPVPVAAVAAARRCRRSCSSRPGPTPARTVIIYLAALTGVNRELYEAASVDGASLWRKVWHITMPQLRGVLLLTMILQIIGTAQVFLEPYLFTSGGPANSTLTVLLLIYDYAFGNSLGGDYGSATALSLMLAALPGRVLARLPARHALLEHDVSRGASARGDGGSSRPSDWRRPRVRWGFGARAGAPARRAGRRSGSGRCSGSPSRRSRRPTTRSRTRCRCSRTARPGATCARRGRTSRSAATSGTRSCSRSARGLVADHRRDHRRVRAVGAAAEVREASSPGSCSRRSSSRPSCCSCRSTSRSCTRR